MPKVNITLHWNKAQQKWLMKYKGRFLYDFWDCGSARYLFPGMSKRKLNHWIWTTEKINVKPRRKLGKKPRG